MKKTVVVGISGGVDSSVSAYLLKKEGYRVIGLFMKNWEEEEDGVCSATRDYEDALNVCKQIDIPLYGVNFSEAYWNDVFKYFLEEYEAGNTPNPDILCNREIKFKALYEKALELGADYLATGHYARNEKINETYHLLKGLDSTKDQSYFIYTLKNSLLEKVLFPIGGLTKKQVKQIAKENDFITYQKKESMGICFIGKRNFKEFLGKYIEKKPGEFQTLSGKVVGHHEGIAYYTIGQRKGLKIGGPGEAWFVVGKDKERGIVYIEQGGEHPALFSKSLVATEISWVGAVPPFPYRCSAKVRYRQQESACTIVKLENEKLYVEFDTPQKAITPRQSVVFYDNEICLGGAIIL